MGNGGNRFQKKEARTALPRRIFYKSLCNILQRFPEKRFRTALPAKRSFLSSCFLAFYASHISVAYYLTKSKTGP
jgi:hypothetical protein